MVIWKVILFALILVNNSRQLSAPQPEPTLVKQWNLLDYNFDLNAPVSDKSFYDPENIVATGIAVGRDRIFVATPRLFSGVSATISTVSRDQFGDSPVLEAYPDWSFHTTSLKRYNCSDLGLVSVYRLRIDSCGRLWALDAGVSRSLEDYEITCPPKILIFDLATNQVVRRIDFPREVRRGESLFTNIIVDENTSKPENKCDDVFAYISDTVEPGIVVYDSARDLTWRVSHPSMFPDPDFAESTIGEYKFTLMDGVVGLAFDPKSRIVYYQPLATDRIFSISTDALRAGPFPRNQALPIKLVGKKSSQGIGMGVSPADGSIFFSPMTETAVASWNPITNEQRVIAYDPERLQFVADMSIAPDDPTGLYVVSSKFHRFFLKNLNRNEVNTRILRIDIGAYGQQFLPTSFSNVVPGVTYSNSPRGTTPYSFGPYFRGSSLPFQFGATDYQPKISPTSLPSTSFASFNQPSFETSYKNFHFVKRA